MNVAFVNFASEWGGGEGWTHRTALGLQEIGHKVLIVGRKTSPFSSKCRESGLKVSELDVSFDYNPSTVLSLWRLFKFQHIDVVVVHHNKDVRLAGVAAHLRKIHVLHRNGFPVIHNNIRHRFTSLFINRILTNSGRIKSLYSTYRWLATKPIDVVPNGIKLLDKDLPDKNVFWKNNQAVIQDGDLVALYSGRLTQVKQVDILLKAFLSLPESSKWKLAVVGNGGQRESLEKFVYDHSLEGRVVFLGFRSDSIELPGFADLVVLPSRDEGMPNSLMEAMALKTPVAASPAGDVEFLLDNGKAGWVITSNVPEEWTNLLVTLEDNPALLAKMGDAGYQRIVEHFTFDKMIKGIESSLKKTLGIA